MNACLLAALATVATIACFALCVIALATTTMVGELARIRDAIKEPGNDITIEMHNQSEDDDGEGWKR